MFHHYAVMFQGILDCLLLVVNSFLFENHLYHICNIEFIQLKFIEDQHKVLATSV